MQVLSSWDLQKGKTTDKNKLGTVWQPMQMISKSDKTDEWRIKNMDWFEQLGILQLRHNVKKTLKNYNLAKGVIEKEDYMPSEENEYTDVLSKIMSDDELPDALDIHFYPIIPNVINVLTGEFSKRNTKMTIKAVDPLSKNEVLDEKYEQIKKYAEAKGKEKLLKQLVESGVQPESEEEMQQMNQELEQKVQSLPEIQNLYNKDYRSLVEQWAAYQNEVNTEAYNMFELENHAFKDLITADQEFWHLKINDNSYNVELWSPLNTFYHKSPDVKYVSEGNYVGRISLMSIPDIIDRYGYKMKAEEIESLEYIYNSSILPLSAGSQPSDYYDTSNTPDNQDPNSLYYHQLIASEGGQDIANSNAFLQWLTQKDTEVFDKSLCRVTELYWKSQKKMGFLTYINELGESISEIVTEDYYVTETPIYDQTVLKEKSAQTLIYGEHIDWIWVNEVYGGIKVNTMLQPGFLKNQSFNPIYLDVKPLSFQFKSEDELWNARLPVEGLAYSDIRLQKPISLVDLMKPYQIIYNLVNNQIKDLLIDELGTVILMDQNYLPKHSMGEDWGKGNMAKAYTAMKDFSILPLDSGIDNLEQQTNFQHFQVMNMEQSNRFMSRLKVGEWAKNEAFATVGITPQRLGSVAASETATGTNTAVNNSYAQTEMYFVNHINFLMPRVREMMINLDQFFQSKNPTVKVQYTNSKDEEIFFEVEGYKLLARDLKVFCTFRPDIREMMKEMKMILMNNNTTNATVYDLLKLYTAETPTEILDDARKSVDEFYRREDEKRKHEQEMLDKQIEEAKLADQANKAFESSENQKDRQVDIAEATIKAMGFANESDVDSNAIPDVLEVSKFNSQLGQFQEKMALESKKGMIDMQKHKDTINLKEKELAVKQQMKEKDLQIAKANKNKYDKK
jgi:hypothetical protein